MMCFSHRVVLFTGQSFRLKGQIDSLSRNNRRLGVLEWKQVTEAEFRVGAEIQEVFIDGTEKLRAVFDEVKFNRVKQVNKMTIKEIEYLKSGSYIYIYDRWLKLSYDDEYRIAYTKDPFF